MFYKKILLFLFLTAVCVSLSCAEVSYDFTLKDLDGRQVSLSDYKGKVVFLDFWATWCPPCRASIPQIEKMYQEFYEDEDFVVLGINMQEDKDTIEKFIKNNEINYPVLLSDNKVISNYKIRSIPAFFVIDRDGEVYKKYTGYGPGMEENWKSDIKKLLD